jgi:glycerol-3-phosphate dehydrogenase
MAGPTATDIEDKEGVNTTSEQIADLLSKAKLSTPNLPNRQVITSFAGLRAHTEKGDFIIEEVKDAPGFIDVAGIESPGLSSAPAIGAYVADLINQIIPAEDNPDFNPTRKGIVCMDEATLEQKQELIAQNPAYANVICRCEMVTEGEILDAIHRPLGATTLDGVKRRTRAGMGRCQAGFCSPKTVEILARELGKDMSEISKNGPKSTFLTGYNKEDV